MWLRTPISRLEIIRCIMILYRILQSLSGIMYCIIIQLIMISSGLESSARLHVEQDSFSIVQIIRWLPYLRIHFHCFGVTGKAALKPRRKLRFTSILSEGTYRPISGKWTSRRRNWNPCGKKRNARISYIRRISGVRPTEHKRYEDKSKAKKKAEIEAKKAAIHVEDMEKGVFIPASSQPKKEPQKAPIPARAAM